MLLILMIALLPLRGWASESMAVSMAVQHLVVAQNQLGGAPGMPADCPLLDQVDQVDQVSNKSTTDASSETISPWCNGCTTCQLCMALVTGYAPMPDIAAHSHHAKRLSSGISFTSAEHAPRFKPPIS